MALTGRTVAALVALALAALALPGVPVGVAPAALAGLTLADALLARATPRVRRTLPAVLARGVDAPLRITVEKDDNTPVRVRQPLVPDLALDAQEGDGALTATLTPRRRGRHTLPAVAL